MPSCGNARRMSRQASNVTDFDVIASEAKQSIARQRQEWIASSRSLSSGAHSRDPLAPRNDDEVESPKVPMSHVPKFHRLAVNDLRRESADAVSLAFAIPEALAADYHFAPGQYLTLRTTMDGEEVRS